MEVSGKKKFIVIRSILLLAIWLCMVAAAGYYLYQCRKFTVNDKLYAKEIHAAAMRYGLDPDLVRAVIYEESRFESSRVGRAGEIGLMQIMPGRAAADWAKVHKRSRPPREMLFSPELNLEIGCWYLRDGLNKFAGYKHATELALARYNAGLTRARRWTPAEKDAPVLDNITFPGTRQYVENIMQRYKRYQTENKR